MWRDFGFSVGFVVVALGLLLLWQALRPVAAPLPIDVVPPVTSTTRADYEPLVPLTVGSSTIYVSVADTPTTRQRGLSNTTNLPADVVKLFVFESDSLWSFWMKDMSYPIDIVWVNATGTIVHVAAAVAPETYPTTFSPTQPTRYVFETNAGLAAQLGWQAGVAVDLANLAL